MSKKEIFSGILSNAGYRVILVQGIPTIEVEKPELVKSTAAKIQQMSVQNGYCESFGIKTRVSEG